MTQITHDVTLPVGIKIAGGKNGKKTKTIKQVQMRAITMADSYAKMIETEDENALTGLLDLSAMAYVPELGRTLTYDELATASRQDGGALEVARAIIEKKEREAQTIDG